MNEESLRKAFIEDRIAKTEGTRLSLPFFEVWDEIGSTNTRAAELAKAGAQSGVLVTAERQTAGRGRRGRVWESPAGSNIAMSLVLRPQVSLAALPQLTIIAAVAVKRAFEALGAAPGIKWPNDVYLSGRKCCGILVESVLEKGRLLYSVAGIGINVKKSAKSPEVAALSTSLEEEGILTEREPVIVRIHNELTSLCETWERTGNLSFILDEYTKSMLWIGENSRIIDASGAFTEGVIRGMNESGELLFETAEGLRSVYAGEVSLRPATKV